jgi:hypothetical protein
MGYVIPKKTLRQVNGHIPAELAEAFDNMVERLGIAKQRAIAASFAAFLRMDATAQFALYQETYARYYAEATGAESVSQDEAAERAEVARIVDEEIEKVEKAEKAARQRKPSRHAG